MKTSNSKQHAALTRLGMLTGTALLTGTLVAGQAALAQSSIEMRTIARASGVIGVPDVRIDLNKPATQKYAVVIGNGDYENVTGLRNATSDSALVADYLRSNGYSVIEQQNLDKRGFEAAMRQMLFDVTEGSEVVFYFAGHGIQIGQSNYLIPTDANLDNVYDVPFEAVSLSSLLSIVGARTRSLIVILDSCRDNPFAGQQAVVGLEDLPKDLQSGFSAQTTPINSLLVFSTSPGAVAFDGDGDNSPFTEALIEVAEKFPEEPVDFVMKEVRRLVYERTDGLQIPWESSSLVETVLLSDGEADGLPTPNVSGSIGSGVQSIAESVSVSFPLNPRIPLGRALQDTLALSSTSSLQVASTPRHGRLEMESNGTARGLVLSEMQGNSLTSISYLSARPQMSATKSNISSVTDEFTIAVNGQTSTVQLNLEVDPCDHHAGDYLDPEGVGVARYPNEIEPEAALAACQAAVAKNPDVGRFHYQLGRVHVALRDLDAAEVAYKQALDLGHTRAFNALGGLVVKRIAETEGIQSKLAPNEALAYFAMGVDKGDPYAIHSLGRQLLFFSEDPEVKRQGFELLSRSLELGHTFSMNALGNYFLEEGSPQYNAQRGLRYLRESAARGDIYGYQNMGFVTLNGIGGTQKDPAAAYEWFLKASNEGHPTAPSSIGRMYTNGQVNGKTNYAQAVTWYDKGLERGDAWGGSNAAWIILNKKPSGFGIGDAAIRAAKAASLANEDAGRNASELLKAMSKKELDAGAQRLMAELGENVTADGAFGPASEESLERIRSRYGRDIPGSGIDRVVALAKVFWENSKLRADLY